MRKAKRGRRMLEAGDQPTPGATGSGYEVLTCQEIISGDVGDWKNNVGVFFYDGYLPPKPARKL